MLNLRKTAVLALIAGIFLAAKAAPAAAATPWFITLHVDTDIKWDLARANTVHQKLKDLGVKGVRFDVLWHEIEPVQGTWNTARLQFYTNYVSNLRSWGLSPMPIVDGMPGWAKDLYTNSRPQYWPAYGRFVEQVAMWIGDRVDYYQMWNEANHINDPIDAGDDWNIFVTAGAAIKKIDPTALRIVNVMANVSGWEAAVTDWLTKANSSIDVIGIDHYPGTWACCSYTDWGPLDTLTRRINTAGDAWYGKKGAVIETGYSSWAWLTADEYDQKDWINQSLPTLRSKVNANNSTKPNKIILLGFYSSVDNCTNSLDGSNCNNYDIIWGQGIEAHFGILHSNYSTKVGYSALKSQIALF